MSNIQQIGDLVTNFGPLVFVIGLLLRSNANKDRVIEQISLQAIQAVNASRESAQAAKQAVDAVKDAMTQQA